MSETKQAVIVWCITEERIQGAMRDIIEHCSDNKNKILSTTIEHFFELWHMLPRSNRLRSGYHEDKQRIISRIRYRLRKRSLALDLVYRSSINCFVLRSYSDSIDRKLYGISKNAKSRNETLIEQLRQMSTDELMLLSINPNKLPVVQDYLSRQMDMLCMFWDNTMETAKRL